MVVEPGLCGTWSEPPKTGFLPTRFISRILLQKGRTGEEFANRPDKERYLEKERKVNTVKFLNFGTPEIFAVIYLKFRQRGQVLGYFVKNTHLE